MIMEIGGPPNPYKYPSVRLTSDIFLGEVMAMADVHSNTELLRKKIENVVKQICSIENPDDLKKDTQNALLALDLLLESLFFGPRIIYQQATIGASTQYEDHDYEPSDLNDGGQDTNGQFESSVNRQSFATIKRFLNERVKIGQDRKKIVKRLVKGLKFLTAHFDELFDKYEPNFKEQLKNLLDLTVAISMRDVESRWK